MFEIRKANISYQRRTENLDKVTTGNEKFYKGTFMQLTDAGVAPVTTAVATTATTPKAYPIFDELGYETLDVATIGKVTILCEPGIQVETDLVHNDVLSANPGTPLCAAKVVAANLGNYSEDMNGCLVPITSVKHDTLADSVIVAYKDRNTTNGAVLVTLA